MQPSFAAEYNFRVSIPGLGNFRWGNIGWAVGVLGIWIAMLDFPRVIASDELDLSWGQAFAYFFAHASQAGVDYIFNYGPLGYFATGNYDAALFGWAFWWNVIFALIFAIGVVRLARFSSSTIKAMLLLLVVVVVDFPFTGNQENFYRTLILSMGLPLLMLRKVSKAMLIYSIAVIAVISQIKFTYALLAAFTVGCAELRYRLQYRRALVSPATLFAIAFCLTWMLAGQHLANIPRYITASMQISTGYLASMGWTEPDPYHVVTIAAVLLGMLFISVILYCISDRITTSRMTIAFVLLACAWVAWKHAITRADNGHLGPFLGLDAILLLLLPITLAENRSFISSDASPARKTLSRLKMAPVRVSFVLCFYGTYRLFAVTGDLWPIATVKANLEIIHSPAKFRGEMETIRGELVAKFSLPVIKSIVRTDSIDIISFEQGVLLLNQFNYHPRPIFQSFQVGNHFLIHENARFFASASAPRYVLFKVEPIDNRFTSIEDSESLFELARRYKPVAFERGFCLLEHLPDGQTHDSVLSQGPRSGVMNWNASVELPDPRTGYQTLSVKIKPSLLGKLLTFLYKEPEVYMNLRLTDGHLFRFRLIPSMAGDEFILSPFIAHDITALYVPSRGQKAAAFSFATTSPDCFEPHIAFELKTYRRNTE